MSLKRDDQGGISAKSSKRTTLFWSASPHRGSCNFKSGCTVNSGRVVVYSRLFLKPSNQSLEERVSKVLARGCFLKFKGSAHPPDFSFQDLMVGHHGDGNGCHGSRSDKDSETGTDKDDSADGSFINDQFCHGPHHQSRGSKGTDCRDSKALFFRGFLPGSAAWIRSSIDSMQLARLSMGNERKTRRRISTAIECRGLCF